MYDPYLKLYLPFYELDGSSFADKSAYGSVATVTNALWRPNGYLLDGTGDYIEVAASASQLNFTSSPFTIIKWVKFDDVSGSHMLFLRSDYSVTGYYTIVRSTASVRLYTLQAGPAGQVSQTGTNEVTTGVWYHLCFVRNGASVKIYKDTVDKTTTSGTHVDPGTDSGAARIGARRDAAVVFAGTIGEVWAYNKPFTAPEIQDNYETTKWRYR